MRRRRGVEPVSSWAAVRHERHTYRVGRCTLQAASMPEPFVAPVPSKRSGVDRLLALADRPAGVGILVVFALLEATIFPGPTEVMLLALTLGRPRRAWMFAGIATAALVVGSIIGYQIGSVLFREVARPLLANYRLVEHTGTVARVYQDNMILALVTSGYTPIPFMLYPMMAGASSLPLLPFIAGSLAGRALKYFPIAGIAYVFGPAVHRILRRYGVAVMLLVGDALVVFLLMRR